MRQSSAKAIARDLLPPALVRLVRRRPPHYSGVYASFDDLPDESPWAGPFWVESSRRRLEDATRAAPGTAPAGARDAYALPCLVVNQVAARGPCRVVDFGGGTGLVYFLLRDALLHRENVSWYVVDSPALAQLGRRHARADDRIAYVEAVPEGPYEVLLLTSMLQYVRDHEAALGTLLTAEPEVCVLSRLVAGDVPDWVTVQTIGGRRCPCRLLNLPALLEWFAARGYEPEYVGAGASLAHMYGRDVPERLRIPHEANVVLRRTGSPR